MSESKSTYQQILKSTTLFGGVQVFNILISIVRSKCIAIFIGPIGMGVASLLTATLNLISGFTSLGLETSAVKFISQDHALSNTKKISKTISILRKLLWITGIVGSMLFFILAPLLSSLTFGNYEYTIAFRWISIALFLKQIAIGELVLLQGLQQLKSLAKANFFGSLFGLIVSLPLYYYLKLEAIVPTIIIASVFVFVFSFYYAKKVAIEKTKISGKHIITEGKAMLQLGIVLSISAVLTLLATYILQIYIGNQNGIMEVGYYNAGFTLLNSYVGIIFTSMATDYYPRLAAVNSNPIEVNKIVSQQALIAVLIITPIIVLFEVFTPFLVRMLFSDKFISIVPMICIGILGMLFRAVSWSMGYIILAKGDSKIFIWNALGFNSLFLILHIIGYNYYGLHGLGIAFLVYYFFHYLVIKMIVDSRYQFKFNTDFNIIFVYATLICLISFSLNFINNNPIKYVLFALIFIISIWFSIVQLNKKIDLKAIILKFTSKYSNKNVKE